MRRAAVAAALGCGALGFGLALGRSAAVASEPILGYLALAVVLAVCFQVNVDLPNGSHVSVGNAVAVAESLALCVTLGVDPKTYYEVVKNGGGMAYSTYFDRRALRIVEGNFEATFTAELMLKDVALAARMAGASLAHMPILRETLAAYGETGAKGWGGQDFSAVTHVVEQRFGRTISGA